MPVMPRDKEVYQMSGNITGSLQAKKGFYYAVVNLVGPDGSRKQ